MEKDTQQIILGGGCFWCLHSTFKLVRGILDVKQGYAGGIKIDPSYEDVMGGASGHAEVVKLTYDPTIIKLDDILDIFWTIHDPTTVNRQGYDVGSQYRSIILYENNEQKKIIEASKEAAQKLWDGGIVTEIKPLTKFYPAESYHYDYQQTRPDYCYLVINPKLAKLREKFSTLLKTS